VGAIVHGTPADIRCTSVELALDASNGVGTMTMRELWELPAWFVHEVRYAFSLFASVGAES
jgi:hypothetical protein